MSLRWYAFLCRFDPYVLFTIDHLISIILLLKCTSRLDDKRIHIKLVSSGKGVVHSDPTFRFSVETRNDFFRSFFGNFPKKNTGIGNTIFTLISISEHYCRFCFCFLFFFFQILLQKWKCMFQLFSRNKNSFFDHYFCWYLVVLGVYTYGASFVTEIDTGKY